MAEETNNTDSVKKSISISRELDAALKALEKTSGDNYSSVLRQILKVGLAAKLRAAANANADSTTEQAVLIVEQPHAQWIIATAAALQIPPDSLLRRIIVEGLVKFMDEARKYRESYTQLEKEHLNDSSSVSTGDP